MGAGIIQSIREMCIRDRALSIQIHPDDEYALENEGEYGKNEMWYVIDCEPGAYLYCGLSKDVSKEEIEERIARCV